ncbi:hypothetical protein BV25DRAFT_1248133 [Artomyces pyxidatus]|uniref:Uncharacterized protein n=1 Tax=Artomyces pyxidatus TaxID=48021 RepID=A0ACB8TEH3_9AGAM|nr:hypothetical protein BV25DRAFT_1248133 [Artomyces pyxidatus]
MTCGGCALAAAASLAQYCTMHMHIPISHTVDHTRPEHSAAGGTFRTAPANGLEMATTAFPMNCFTIPETLQSGHVSYYRGSTTLGHRDQRRTSSATIGRSPGAMETVSAPVASHAWMIGSRCSGIAAVQIPSSLQRPSAYMIILAYRLLVPRPIHPRTPSRSDPPPRRPLRLHLRCPVRAGWPWRCPRDVLFPSYSFLGEHEGMHLNVLAPEV